AEHLDVGAAGERRARAEQQLARLERQQLDHLDPHVLAAVQHGRAHPPCHAASPDSITFSVPGACDVASANASRPRATGSRWVTSSATRTLRLKTSSAASCCRSIEEL